MSASCIIELLIKVLSGKESMQDEKSSKVVSDNVVTMSNCRFYTNKLFS